MSGKYETKGFSEGLGGSTILTVPSLYRRRYECQAVVLVDTDEAGMCAVEKEAEGGETKAFAGVSAVQARAGASVFFDGFFGDGLERGSMLWGPWGRPRRQRRQQQEGLQWMNR